MTSAEFAVFLLISYRQFLLKALLSQTWWLQACNSNQLLRELSRGTAASKPAWLPGIHSEVQGHPGQLNETLL